MFMVSRKDHKSLTPYTIDPHRVWSCVFMYVCVRRMKLLVLLYSVALVVCLGEGQETPDPLCVDVEDFHPCNILATPKDCVQDVSQCYCRDKVSYCRCNNFRNEWFIGEDCSHKWTVVTFALVASLPGLALALLVGLIVHLVHYTRKNSSASGGGKGKERKEEEDPYPGLVFASDLNAQPEGLATNPGHPMANLPGRSHSQQNARRPYPVNPSMGGPNPPYSQQNGTRPYPVNPSMGGPNSPYSSFNGVSASPDVPRPSYDRQRLTGSPQPYSYTAGSGQVLTNPYVRGNPDRNQYEDGTGRDNQGPASTFPQNGTRGGMAGFPSPDYSGGGSQFPRAQFGRY